MPNLRVMSWNLRTFGSNTTLTDIELIAKVIHDSNADVVCIQEVQIGNIGPSIMDTPIDPSIIKLLDDLKVSLNSPPNCSWDYNVTHSNKSNRTNSMTDAYAFFYLTQPSKLHSSSFQSIFSSTGAKIVRMTGKVRQPGMISLILSDGSSNSDLNIISIHAPTPGNDPMLPFRYILRLGAISFLGCESYNTALKPMNKAEPPNSATILLGDFNYNVNAQRDAYESIKKLYFMNIGDSSTPVHTTYSPIEPYPHTTNSSYDNIFSLLPSYPNPPNPKSRPIQPISPGYAIDFINQLMPALKTSKPGLTDAVYFNALYKGQHRPNGLSDHLPVVQDFSI